MKSKKRTLTYNLLFITFLLVLTAIYFYIFSHRYIDVTSVKLVDDTLQANLAMSMSQGKWLGSYIYTTLAKGLSMPFFLYCVHLTRIPYAVALSILNYSVVIVLLLIVGPFIKKYSRTIILVFLVLFLFNPLLFSYSQATTYRDATAYAAMIILMAWFVGLILNSTVKLNIPSLILTIISGIVAVPYWYHLREDSNWITPLLVLGLLVTGCYLIINKQRLKNKFPYFIVTALLPLLCSLGLNSYIANKNYAYYGDRVVNNYTSKDFKQAMGTMMAIPTDKWVINVPVNTSTRQKLYAHVPAFKKLQPYLDNHGKGTREFFKNYGAIEPSLHHDYQGGWFPWAYRAAVQDAGYGKSARQFARYNTELTKEIVRAEKEGKIPGNGKTRASLVSPFTVRVVKPSLKASVLIAGRLFTYHGEDLNFPISGQYDAIGQKIIKFIDINTDARTVNVLPLSLEQNYTKLYSVLQFILFVMGIFMLASFLKNLRNHQVTSSMTWMFLINLGLLLSIIIRIIMLGYVSATSFLANSYAYLSSDFSLLTIFLLLSLIYWVNNSKKLDDFSKKHKAEL